MADEPGEYTLKPGMRHSAIIKGEHVSVVGDTEGTVKVLLSAEAAESFKDKLADYKKPEPAKKAEPAKKEEPAAAASEAAPAKK